ncbi:MAG: hypothetical protein R3E48_12660 [Burkholderiaceae bacterium]
MTRLSVYDPFSEVFPELFRSVLQPSVRTNGDKPMEIRVDVKEAAKAYTVEAEIQASRRTTSMCRSTAIASRSRPRSSATKRRRKVNASQQRALPWRGLARFLAGQRDRRGTGQCQVR